METKQSFMKKYAYKAAFVCMLLSFACIFLPWYTFTVELSDGGNEKYSDIENIASDDEVIWEYLQRYTYKICPSISSPEEVDWLLMMNEMPFDEAEYLSFFRKQLSVLKRGWLSWIGVPSFLRNYDKQYTLEELTSLNGNQHAVGDTDDTTINTYHVSYSFETRQSTKLLYLLIVSFACSLMLFYYRLRIAELPYAACAIWLFFNAGEIWVHRGLNRFFSLLEERNTFVPSLFVLLALAGAVLAVLSPGRAVSKEQEKEQEEEEEQEAGGTSGKRRRVIPVLALLACAGALFFVYRNSATMQKVRYVTKDDIMYVIHGEEASVSGLDLRRNMEELVIPETIEGVPVVSVVSLEPPRSGTFFVDVHSTSFLNRDAFTVKKLVLPDSVRTLWIHGLCCRVGIGKRPSVTVEEVVFGEGLIWVNTGCEEGERIFSDTSVVTIPASVRELGEGALQGAGMCEVRFESRQITAIPDECFYYCSNLERVDLPPSVSVIGQAAFYECPLLEEVCGAEMLDDIARRAFSGCTSLKRLDGFDKEKTKYNETSFEGTPFLE
ncbi:MAG: leucine-rich repeat domain-containing protein [Lachnospiraceae bacterium]|nr:leucine-rich repeat domain-containing protein [Lachnospiraceae bacterium]